MGKDYLMNDIFIDADKIIRKVDSRKAEYIQAAQDLSDTISIYGKDSAEANRKLKSFAVSCVRLIVSQEELINSMQHDNSATEIYS